MATATRERNVMQPELSLDSNIAARARALREGKKMPELSARFEPEEFVNQHIGSGPCEMSREDVCNVEPLDANATRTLFARLQREPSTRYTDASGTEYEIWDASKWRKNDERWELTPHELRKLRERQASRTFK